MSWLTPKRRKTTGDLKTLPNGQFKTSGSIAEGDENNNMDAAASLKAIVDRPSQTPRPVSQPNVSNGSQSGEGNLFYAYARQVCYTTSDGVGGAAQGIIPVQDAQGNMLGGTAPASPEFGKHMKQEAKGMRNDIGRLEGHFEKMMDAVERNTDSIRQLAGGKEKEPGKQADSQRGYFDTSELGTHLGRITDLLARNQEYMETMSKRQFENEKKLRELLEDTASKREARYVDMSQLTSHLDRIQDVMEKSAIEKQEATRPVEVDLTPLACRLERIQEAMDRNSALLEDMLEQRGANPSSSYPQKIDFAPLADHLGIVYAAVEKQSENLQALVDLATTESERSHENTDTLQQILEAQHATRDAVEQNGGEIDFTPMAEHMDAMTEATAENTEQIRSLVHVTQQRSECSSPAQLPGIDFSPMTDRLDRVHASLQKTNDYFQTQVQTPGSGSERFLVSALASHLSKVQAVVESNAKALSRSLAPRINTSEPRSKAESDALEKRLDATNSQVRELMTGQREMVSVLRELSVAISAQNKGACDHVVIPPPRKVGRKLVGFVYDAKEGAK